jgi:hypothetical protein
MRFASSTLLSALTVSFSLTLAAVAHADVAPLCTELDAYAGCDAAAVGTACDPAKPAAKCAELSCEDGGNSKVYKCVVACADVVPKGTGDACSPGGTTCGTNGTCKTYEGECYGNIYSRIYCDDGTTGQAGSSSGEAGSSSGEAGSSSGQAGSSSGQAGTSSASAGSAGESGSTPAADDDSGCSVSGTKAATANKRGLLAALITLSGAAALFVSRRRRSSDDTETTP